METLSYDTPITTKSNVVLSRLFRIMAILAIAGIAWSLFSLLLTGISRCMFDSAIDPTAASVVALIMNIFQMLVSYGISIAMNILYLPASKHMENATHQKLTRIGGIVSVVSLGVYLLCTLVSSSYSIVYYLTDAYSGDMAELLAAIGNGRTLLVTLLSLTMPAGRALCAVCFITHPKPAVKTLSIILLASVGVNLLLNLLPIHYNPAFTAVSAVLAFVANIIGMIFFFTVSHSYREIKGVDNI